MSDVELEALAATQHGVFSRAQALTHVSSNRIHDHVARERWDRPLPSVYRVVAVPRSFRQRAMAAALWSAPDGLVAFESCARLLDLPAPRTSRVAVLTADARRLRHPDVEVHRTADLLPADVTTAHGIPCTSALRTVVDLAATLQPDTLELVIEAALRRGMFSAGQLRWRAALRTGRGVSGSARIAPLLDRRLGGTDSGWEVRVEQILRAAGLPDPVRQLAVETIDGRRWVDLGYPGSPTVVFEYDSDQWHTGVTRRRRDAARRNALRMSGCTVIEVTAELVAEPDRLVRIARTVLSASVSHPLGSLRAWE